MKLTSSQLRKIIKEEFKRVVEAHRSAGDEDPPEKVHCSRCGYSVYKDDATRSSSGSWVCSNKSECHPDEEKHDLDEGIDDGIDKDTERRIADIASNIISTCIDTMREFSDEDDSYIHDTLMPDVNNMIVELITDIRRA